MAASDWMRIGWAFCGIMSFVILPAHAQDVSPQHPRSLHPDIRVEHYMEVAEESIRLVLDPSSGDMYYNTLGGDIYRIIEQGKDEKLFSVEDHGIPRLQGMAFHGSDLFLSGNIEANGGLGSKGIVMRGTSESSGTRSWSTVAVTVEHGEAQTVFNHGFNGIIVDPDGGRLYVNSGARTDHGEVQDNRGHYPGQRDIPTTAVILKLPLDGHDILLTHDEKLMEPYTFARGVRNVYDMAFAPGGELFGVSNSSDYDHPEDMFWLREGHHYGFPWIIGGGRNPQQDPTWHPDPDADHLLPRTAHAYMAGYFHNEPDFPKMPDDLVITPSVQNIGPDANHFRDSETGKILKGDRVGKAIGTFSPHRSPLGLVFDRDSVLAEDFRGDGFVIGHSSMSGGMSRPFGGAEFGVQEGEDLMHLELFYSEAMDNYIARVTRIVDNFDRPTDALMIGRDIYIINHSRSGPGHIWKVEMP